MKLSVLFLLCLIQFGCVQEAVQSVPLNNATTASADRPRLSRKTAIRLAEKSPVPHGYNRTQYRFSGNAMFFTNLAQWGVGYEPRKFTGIPGDHFVVWIDDVTGSFIRFGYGR